MGTPLPEYMAVTRELKFIFLGTLTCPQCRIGYNLMFNLFRNLDFDTTHVELIALKHFSCVFDIYLFKIFETESKEKTEK